MTDETGTGDDTIVDFVKIKKSIEDEQKIKQSIDTKTKLENYRSVFNYSPSGSENEKKAIRKIAELAGSLPDDEKQKFEFVRLAVDFYEEDAALIGTLLEQLKILVPTIEDKEELLRTYRVILRNKQADDKTRTDAGSKIMDLLEE